MASSTRKGSGTQGQLTSGLRGAAGPKRNRRGVFAEGQLHKGGGAISRGGPLSPRPDTNTSLRDIDEITNGSDQRSELNTTPPKRVPKISGGLGRETTSFGVFSNLAAHNRQPKHEASTESAGSALVAKPGPQTQLIKAIKDNDPKQVTRILKSNSNMIMNFTNESGQTALQVAASLGLEHVAHILIQAGADVNLHNKVTGFTALHEAVSKGHTNMVNVLLCCNADYTVKTKDGLTLLDLCRDKHSRRALEAAVAMENSGRMELATIGQTKAVFISVDITVEPRQIEEPTCAMCRRSGVSKRNNTVKFGNHEEIISDEFSLRLGNKDIAYHVIVTFPIEYDNGMSSEEVVVKTADGAELKVSEFWQENESFRCKFNATINHSATFVAVRRPKTEQLVVSRGASVITSEVHLNVKIHVGKGSFSKSGHISLRVLEINEDIDMEVGEILSSTPYYCLNSSAQLTKPIDLELPEPVQYGEEQITMVVMTKRSVNDNWSVEKSVKRTNKAQGAVIFAVPVLPVDAVVLQCKNGFEATTITNEVHKTFEQLTKQTNEVCFLCLAKRLQTEKKFTVILEWCKVKMLDSRRQFWISKDYVEQQERSRIDHFSVSPNQAFSVVFYENILLREGRKRFTLEFLPKRNNFVEFDVHVDRADSQSGRIYVYQDNVIPENEDDLMTSIDVSLNSKRQDKQSSVSVTHSDQKIRGDNVINKQGVGRRQEKQPTISAAHSEQKISGNKVINKQDVGRGQEKQSTISAAPSEQKISSNKVKNKQDVDKRTRGVSSTDFSASEDSKQSSSYDDGDAETKFLTDEYLATLVDQMEEDWYKTFVLMYVPFSDIDQALERDVSSGKCKIQLFKEWRESNNSREDIGLPLLLSALFKGCRRDVANTIQVDLRNWYRGETNKNLKLYQWLSKAYQDSNLFVPSDYPKPMSDSYLVLMADEIVPSPEFGLALGLLDSDIDAILNSRRYMYPGIKVMKMLTMFRETIPSKLEALKRLIECLEKLNYDKLKNYAVMCAKAWVRRTATRKDDPLRTQVDTLMKQL